MKIEIKKQTLMSCIFILLLMLYQHQYQNQSQLAHKIGLLVLMCISMLF